MTTETHQDAHVSIVRGGDASPEYAERRQQHQQSRTDAQRHADTAWDAAEADLDTMAEALASNIRWVQSLGVPVPSKVLDIKPILSEYRATLADERASRG